MGYWFHNQGMTYNFLYSIYFTNETASCIWCWRTHEVYGSHISLSKLTVLSIITDLISLMIFNPPLYEVMHK